MQRESQSVLDKYVRLEQPKQPEEHVIPDREIRITGPGKTRNYIAYATGLLAQQGCTAVELKAMGQAINKTVTIAEIIKRRILGLHQNNQIASIAIQDTWEPIEEGLDSISVTRHVSVISITLSTVPLDEKSPGYQPPLPASLVKTHITPTQHPSPHSSDADLGAGAAAHMGGGGSMVSVNPGSGMPGSNLGSGGSFSGGLSLDSFGMGDSLHAQHLLQAQGMRDVAGQLALQADQALGPVVHFDGRDHARNPGRHRCGAAAAPGGRTHMLGGGLQ